MDPNLVTVDISSDDAEVGCHKTGGGCDSHDWLSGFVDQYVDDSDEVMVIGEVKPKIRNNYVDDDECMILDDDPDNPVAEVNGWPQPGGADDLLIVGHKGQIACRDYPHPRSICAKFPFASSPHEMHCHMCYCYVCESPAPCAHWGTGISIMDHCHATDTDAWKLLRGDFKGGEKLTPKFVSPLTSPALLPDSQIWRIPAASVCSMSMDSEIQRFRNQGIIPQLENNWTIDNSRCQASLISQRSHSVRSKNIRHNRGHGIGYLGPRSSSSHQKFTRAGSVGGTSAHRSQYLRGDHPVKCPDIVSESGTYLLSSSPTNVDSFVGQRNPIGHRNRNRNRSHSGGPHLQPRGKRCVRTRQVMDSGFPNFSSDYDHHFPPLPRPAESSVAEF